MTGVWIAIAVGLVVGLAVGAAWWRSYSQRQVFARARSEFQLRREYLEAKFFELAAASGRPRGLEWVDCDFENEVAYARDREADRITALVAVAIRFEAIEGGGMEDVEAVGNLKAATAVFQYSNQGWATEGRTIFNLSPTQTIEHYRLSLESIPPDVAAGSA
jgi:hypothetical protein